MADYMERRFSIDPGKGKKMDGCPYSVYEDGRDVREYIIPPKGHVFKGFRFDPNASNQIYDGKLTAEYEKEPFNDILKSNLWKFLLPLGIIAIITMVIVLALIVFNKPKTGKPAKAPESTEGVSTTGKDEEKGKANEDAQPSHLIDTIAPNNDTANLAEMNDEVIPELNASKNTTEATPQLAPEDPNIHFKTEFWTLIHQRTILMDPYDKLYKANKNEVEGEEYEYLRYTILKDFNSFKIWSGKLFKVSDLEAINTLQELKNKLNEIE